MLFVLSLERGVSGWSDSTNLDKRVGNSYARGLMNDHQPSPPSSWNPEFLLLNFRRVENPKLEPFVHRPSDMDTRPCLFTGRSGQIFEGTSPDGISKQPGGNRPEELYPWGRTVLGRSIRRGKTTMEDRVVDYGLIVRLKVCVILVERWSRAQMWPSSIACGGRAA